MKRTTALALALVASTAAAQQSVKSRPLGAVLATSKELIGLPTLARPLPNGSVIVNDPSRRRLLLLDPSLESYTVIADSTSGSTNGYGQRPGSLIPYVADSTLFLDATAGSFLVIDPTGKVARVMSPPRPSDNNAIANIANGFPGFDAKGRMVYRTSYRPVPMQTRDGGFQMPTPADSAPLLRVDLDSRRADTLANLRTPRFVSTSITMSNGMTGTTMSQVPLSTIDDWAVLSDGSIAIVRGRDYRIDFILPDGSKKSSDKITFDWKRLNDDDKLALVDSIQKARTAAPGMNAGGPQMMTSFGGGDGMRVMMGAGGGGQQIATREVMVAGAAAAAATTPPAAASSTTTASGATAPTGTPAASGSAATAAAGAPAGMGMPTIPAPAIADMPDYMPAFTQTSARADADANLWIRTTTAGALPGNLVYDVINSQGVLVDRVDVPKGMQIVGFAKGGIVFLSQREGYGYRVLKASIR